MKTITDSEYEEWFRLKHEREHLDWVERLNRQREKEAEARRAAWDKAVVEDWLARGGRNFGDM